MSDSSSPIRVALVSLGCPKNLVDSEGLLGSLDPERFVLCADADDAEVAIVNTCGFLESARQESIETILELARKKTPGGLRGLVVTGCIVPRHRDELVRELPEVDAFLSFADYPRLPETCLEAAGRPVPRSWREAELEDARLPLTPAHTGYLKIAEGCSNPCSFCTIPLIRGKLASRTLDDLVAEARQRVEAGAVELNLIAQDTTDWGKDLFGTRRPETLLRALGEIDGLRWIRVLYAYPAHVTPAFVREMAENDRVVKYLDMPVQHASATVLKRMRRGWGGERLLRLVQGLRDEIPGVALRTTVIVGFPGETDAEFEELLRFLEAVRFERLGAFPYSREEGTPAADTADPVPEELVEERWHRVMALQQDLTFARNRELVGGTVESLVEAPLEDGLWLGRTFADAPDIDGTIRIAGDDLRPGSIGSVRVTAADGYDLEGTWVSAG
jgi:ribosomal protein S12 methylthiotransferase